MNPFTRFLSQRLQNRQLHEFIEYWDLLERLVIQVYRQKVALTEIEEEFQRVWEWLRRHYSRWETSLQPHWQQTKAGGKPTDVDPFRLLLALNKPSDVLGNWRAMQHLPAAREALNRFVASQLKESEG